MRFKTAVNEYLHTRQFASLAASSQRGYETALNSFCRMSVNGRTLGNISIHNINVPLCTEIYDTWELETSTANANHNARIFSVV